MLRCEPQAGNGVLVVASSSSPDLGIEPREDCAVVLEGLLNNDYSIRSVTTGSAEAGDTLRLYTDYLLIGKCKRRFVCGDDLPGPLCSVRFPTFVPMAPVPDEGFKLHPTGEGAAHG